MKSRPAFERGLPKIPRSACGTATGALIEPTKRSLSDIAMFAFDRCSKGSQTRHSAVRLGQNGISSSRPND